MVILEGCAGLRPFPTKTLIEYDARHKVCGQYEIVDAETFKFKYIKDIPCVSIFGFSETDIPKVLNWARDAQKHAKEHCN